MKPNELAGLRAAVESHYGSPLKVHSDFEMLSRCVAISPSTLKRIWGYNTDHQSISPKSTDILAQYLGYDNYEDFINSHSLDSDEHQQLYAASKIAMLADKVHSDRFTRAFELYDRCEYREMLESLESIDEECEVLTKSAEPFIESVNSVIAEMCLKAMAVWSCHYQEEGVIKRINEIFERAIPLAKSINDHYSLWFIYQNWALWSLLSEDGERALEMYELAITQGKILQLESPDENPNELVMVMNDKAFLLTEYERYEEALQLIEEAQKHKCEPLVGCYLRLNYAKCCTELKHDVDCIEIYKEIITAIEQLHQEEEPSNESIKLLAFANFNIGVHCQDIIAEPDPIQAAHYLREAIAIFESRDVPTPEYDYYHSCAVERLRIIEG